MELGSGMLDAAKSFWKIDVKDGESCEGVPGPTNGVEGICFSGRVVEKKLAIHYLVNSTFPDWQEEAFKPLRQYIMRRLSYRLFSTEPRSRMMLNDFCSKGGVPLTIRYSARLL